MRTRGPLATTISYYQTLHHVTSAELAAAARMSVRTLYDRMADEDFKVSALRAIKKKLHIPDGILKI